MLFVTRQTYLQVLSVCSVCLMCLNCGIHFSWTSQAIPEMLSPGYELNVTMAEASYLAVIPQIAVIILTAPIMWIADRLGRRPLILINVIPQVLTWLLIARGGSIWVFYAARLVSGVADVIAYLVVPVYIAEICQPVVRSSWGNCVILFSSVGYFLSNVLQSLLGIRRTALVCAALPLLILLLVLPLTVESPYYDIMRRRERNAMKALCYLRSTTDESSVLGEAQAMEANITECYRVRPKFSDLFTNRVHRKALIATVLLRFTQHFCGMTAILAFCQMIFDTVAESPVSATTSTYVVGAAMIVAHVFGVCALSVLRRRICLQVSTIACATIFYVIAAFFAVLQYRPDLVPSKLQLIPLIMLLVCMPLFSIGCGLLPPVMTGELFAMSMKRYGGLVTYMFNGLFVASVNKMFQLLATDCGMFAPFIFFGTSSLVALVGICYCVPETFRKTLEEIQEGFSESQPILQRKVNGATMKNLSSSFGVSTYSRLRC